MGGVPTPGSAAFDVLDAVRRSTGMMMDALGHGPRTAPSTVRDVGGGVQLRSYPGAGSGAAPVLLVPAPIKRSYIWDLQPDLSVVRRCQRHGLRVHMVEWSDCGPGDQWRGLDEYAGRMLVHCLRAVAQQTGAVRVPVIGHSLGGTFAAIFAARHPEIVAAVVLLEAPLGFGPDAGAFTRFVSAAGGTPDLPDGVPGSLLDVVAGAAAPGEFQLDRWVDLVRSLADPAALASYLRVLRWTMDEFRLPRRLFEDVVESLYREDRFRAGALTVEGRRVGPDSLVVPLLNVVDPASRVVPPRSVLPFHEAAASREKAVLEYHGDSGVLLQHVGVLVGRNAHRELWPAVLGWLDRQISPGSS